MGELCFKDVIKFIDKALVSDKRLLLCGGEPTIWNKIIELTRHACQNYNAEVHMLSNARRFSDHTFLKRIENAGLRHVRASLYGHTSSLQKYLTGVHRSFKETVDGITNLIDSSIGLEVRTLATKITLPHLPNFVRFLSETWPSLREFCVMAFDIDGLATKSKDEFACSFSYVGPFLEKAFLVGESIGVKVKTINFPLCTVERKFASHLVQFDNVRSFYINKPYLSPTKELWNLEWDNLFKPTNCLECSYFECCSGALKTHLNHFGDHELTPLK